MDIICLAFPAWEGNYFKSTVALMQGLADRGNRVLYVDYAYTWKDWFSSLFGRGFASWKRMVGLEPRLRLAPTAKGASLWVLTLPPVMPVNFLESRVLFDLIMAINGFWVRRCVRRHARQLQFDCPVVVNAFNPAYGLQLAGRLGETRLVYYCYDDIASAAWAGKHGARLEGQFMDLVNATIVSSEGLLAQKMKPGRSVYMVKNGVDFDLFASEQGRAVIPGVEPNQRIVGYLGSIDDRLDYDMLEAGFRAFPQVLFVMVGRIQTDAIKNRLSAFSNVYLAGPQPPATLPAWVQRMDVGLIPFVRNAFTAGIYPLKINEYLACGKQVISTRFAPLAEFETVAHWANTPLEFVSLLEKALGISENKAGQNFARGNDWSARAAALERILVNRAFDLIQTVRPDAVLMPE